MLVRWGLCCFVGLLRHNRSSDLAVHDAGDSGLKVITRTDGLCGGPQEGKIIKTMGASKASTG